MTVIYEIGSDYYDPFWRSYFQGEYSNGQSKFWDQGQIADGYWQWQKFFRQDHRAKKMVFPCSRGIVGPAIGAKLSGPGLTMRVSCHHELEQSPGLWLALAGRIISGSASILQALQAKKVPAAKLAEVELPVVAKIKSFSSDEVVYVKPTILALPTSRAKKHLASVVHIASLVYNARNDFQLAVCIDSQQDRAEVKALEQRYDSDGMCVFIENDKISLAHISRSMLVLNGPEYIDDPLRYALVDNLGKELITGDRTRADFVCGDNCKIIEDGNIRQFACAIYASLKRLDENR